MSVYPMFDDEPMELRNGRWTTYSDIGEYHPCQRCYAIGATLTDKGLCSACAPGDDWPPAPLAAHKEIMEARRQARDHAEMAARGRVQHTLRIDLPSTETALSESGRIGLRAWDDRLVWSICLFCGKAYQTDLIALQERPTADRLNPDRFCSRRCCESFPRPVDPRPGPPEWKPNPDGTYPWPGEEVK